MTGRIVVVGDVHGCSRELEELLAKIGVGAADRIFMVGDLVVRGPDPHGVLKLVRSVGAEAVRGNHEWRLLRRRAGGHRKLNRNQWLRATAEQLDDEDWAHIESLPLWRDARDDLRIVHAGVVPGIPFEQQAKRTLLYIRSIGPDGTPSELRDDANEWGLHYQGPPHIVFGHNAQASVQRHPWATGIDTGCVYGFQLTALVLDGDAPIPPPEERLDALVSVQAHEVYYQVG